MADVFGSRKFIAAILSSIIMGVLIVLHVDLTTASLIVAPLAAYVPFQALSDLRSGKLTDDEVVAIRKLLTPPVVPTAETSAKPEVKE
jgi:hypothetical protein